ncbi:alpha-ketoacid dehydrogenase subunit beta [Streptomyces sp. NPDC057674]|uniref:alpha-ketoacid dehydrogenase subunit beta n=1 Tax=Streptomyces sp. NPDC057674 TaxID=3346203 RepID=UPI0036828924
MAATMVEAINTALREAMAEDERVVVFGQDVARQGGVFRVTEGLAERFGPQRCFDTPLAESAIVGVALGMAMRGLRPVPEIQFDGFTYPALDQIVSHLAKYRNRTRGALSVPVTLRVPSFGGIGAVEHHSESTETFWAHTAGLRVVTPATAADAHVLLRQSIDCDDPVIFLEPKRRYWQSGDETAEVPAAGLEQALVRRSGTDVTVVAYGGTVGTALEAAETARREHGWELEVVDLRSLAPLDFPTIAASVSRTGRCVVLHEGPRTLGLGAEIAARVQEELFWDLEAPVLRVTGFDTPYPPARWEKAWLPGVDRLLDGIDRSFGHSHD